MFRTASRGIVILVVAVALSGCERVDPDESDTTPPVVVWRVSERAGGGPTEYPSSPSAAVPVDEDRNYLVVLAAEDPGGMAWIELGASTTFHCASGDVGATGQTDEFSHSYEPTPDEEGRVDNEALLFDSFNTSWDCQDGYSLTGLYRTFVGEARNAAGLTTPAQITLAI